MRSVLFFTMSLGLVPALASAQIGQSIDGESAPATTTSEPAAAPSEASSSATAPRSSDSAAGLPSFASGPTLAASPSIHASTGFARTHAAHGLERGQFGLSLWGEYYGGSSVVVTDDEVRRFIGTLGLSWTPFDFFEAAVEIGARATTNTLGETDLIQSVGDFGLSLKGFYEFVPGVSGGALLRILFPAGANQVGIDPGASVIDILALATADLRDLASIPALINFNFGYTVDNSSELFGERLDRIDRFGHNVYDYNRVRLGLGVAAPLNYVTPYVEWTQDFPTGAQCENIAQPCVTDNGYAAFPNFITVGAKAIPLGDTLAINVGVDLGLTTKESQGTPAVPAWNFLFGLSYNLDPGGTGAVAAPEPIALGWVTGTVIDAATNAPIDGARIRYVDTEYTDQVTGADGRFRSIEFVPGTTVSLEIGHPDYVARTIQMTVAEEVADGTIALESAITGALIEGLVTSSGGTLSEVSVALRGAQDYDAEVGADGSFDLEVEPGQYLLVVSAPGHVSVRETTTFEAGRQEQSFQLRTLAPGDVARFTTDAIVLEPDGSAIGFVGGALAPDAGGVLDDVAALLNADTTSRVRIRTHIDAQELVETEVPLTEERAMAIRDALITRGISPSRLEIDAVGSAEPLFPNSSERNRRRNNRVEFILLAP